MSLFYFNNLNLRKKTFDRTFCRTNRYFFTGTSFFSLTLMDKSSQKNDKDLQEIKEKLKTMYSKEKSRRPCTKRCAFINPNKCIERKYRETKKF